MSEIQHLIRMKIQKMELPAPVDHQKLSDEIVAALEPSLTQLVQSQAKLNEKSKLLDQRLLSLEASMKQLAELCNLSAQQTTRTEQQVARLANAYRQLAERLSA